jgi:hypothetical protein
MSGLAVFGLVAVGLMVLFYGLEARSPWFVLLFAFSCVAASLYGFLQGAWPFGLAEGLWSILAMRRFIKIVPPPTPAPVEPADRPIDAFFNALQDFAKPVGQGDWLFRDDGGNSLGRVQFIIESPNRLTIHRLMSDVPDRGTGSRMLRTLCDLADEHGVELELKVIPIGAKPYPRSREQLAGWYARYGFEGTHKKMLRTPRVMAEIPAATRMESHRSESALVAGAV